MALTPSGVSEEWAATPWKSTRKTFIDLCPRMTRMLGGGDRLDEVDRAHTPDLLVIGEGEVDGFAQLRGGQLFEAGEDDADEGLHVRAAAGVVPAVADLGGERIRGPVLAVDGDDISV